LTAFHRNLPLKLREFFLIRPATFYAMGNFLLLPTLFFLFLAFLTFPSQVDGLRPSDFSGSVCFSLQLTFFFYYRGTPPSFRDFKLPFLTWTDDFTLVFSCFYFRALPPFALFPRLFLLFLLVPDCRLVSERAFTARVLNSLNVLALFSMSVSFLVLRYTPVRRLSRVLSPAGLLSPLFSKLG